VKEGRKEGSCRKVQEGAERCRKEGEGSKVRKAKEKRKKQRKEPTVVS
jgi:hypothetical protein